MKPVSFHLAAALLLAFGSLTLAQGAGVGPGGKIQDRHPSGALIGTTGLTVPSPAADPDVAGKPRPPVSPWISPSTDAEEITTQAEEAAPVRRKSARKRVRQQPQQQQPQVQ